VEKTILIVDDDQEMGNLMKKVLERESYRVILAANGTEGLLRIREQRFDLIISDLRMPGLSGMDLIREIQKTAPEIPVVLITAFGDMQVYLDAMGAGAFEYINKPIRMEDLKRVIGMALEGKQRKCGMPALENEIPGSHPPR